jgi:hypothetical protein
MIKNLHVPRPRLLPTRHCVVIVKKPKHTHSYLFNEYTNNNNKNGSAKMICKMSMVDDLNNLATNSYFIAKGVILFTLFYTSLNYLHYRRLRKDLEEHTKKETKRIENTKQNTNTNTKKKRDNDLV